MERWGTRTRHPAAESGWPLRSEQQNEVLEAVPEADRLGIGVYNDRRKETEAAAQLVER